MRLDDPGAVREEYASETRFAARKAAHARGGGADARQMLFDAIAEIRPARVLDVGAGEGEVAEWMQNELGCEVVAVDQSSRMVELTRARHVDARLGDVRELPFEDESFDCAVAAWMLYHVAEIDRALRELARVLRPSGRLVAVTNGREHLRELWELLDMGRMVSSFDAEDAGELLARHFPRVERRDAAGWLAFSSRDEAQRYVDASAIFESRELPDFDGPLRVHRAPVIFVAHKT